MALITWEGTIPATAFTAVGGQGKLTYTDSTDSDVVVNINLGNVSTKSPIFFPAGSDSNLSLGQGAFISTSTDITIQEYARANDAISGVQTITDASEFATEGRLTSGTNRLLIGGTGKAEITTAGRQTVLALDELNYPFLHDGPLEVLGGSSVNYVEVVDSTVVGQINYSPTTLHRTSTLNSSVSVHSGQGIALVQDSDAGISDVSIRLNRVAGFPVEIDSTQTVTVSGSGLLFATTEVTV